LGYVASNYEIVLNTVYTADSGVYFRKNVHLVQKWLPALDKKMEASFERPHDDYRIFISAEPAADPLYHIIPQVCPSLKRLLRA